VAVGVGISHKSLRTARIICYPTPLIVRTDVALVVIVNGFGIRSEAISFTSVFEETETEVASCSKRACVGRAVWWPPMAPVRNVVPIAIDWVSEPLCATGVGVRDGND